MNETLVKQERNLDKTDLATELQQIYDPSISRSDVSLPGADVGSPLPVGPEDQFPTDQPFDLGAPSEAPPAEPAGPSGMAAPPA